MRGSWAIVGLIIVTTLLVIIPPTRRGNGGSGTAGKTTVQFTVWGMPFEDRLFEDRYARGYERLFPEIRVDYQRYGQDLLLKYNAWHTLGRGPEVMRIRVTDYHGMVARGMLEPLSKYIHAPPPAMGLSQADLDDLPSQLVDILRVDGELYALPEDNAQYGLFYNRSIFDRYNAAHPADPVPYPSAAWTWADLRAAARKLTVYDDSGHMAQAGLDFFVWSWPFITLHAQAGGHLWSEDGLTCTINTPAGVEALEFLRALQREDRSFRPSFGIESGSGPDALFAAGRTAMYLDGSWRVPDMEGKSPNLDFAVAPLPRGKVPAVVSGSVLWGISSKARNKDEGWRMIRWLIAPEQALEYRDVLRVAAPARRSVLASEAFQSTRGIAKPGAGYEVPPMPAEKFKDRAAWILYANEAHPDTGRPPGFVPVNPNETELEDEIQRMLESYLNPSSTESAQEVLDRVVRNIHNLIDRDRSARGLAPVRRAG